MEKRHTQRDREGGKEGRREGGREGEGGMERIIPGSLLFHKNL